jgi:pyridinium-3,5-biscarboxylic acid mononucleotide sulfurtransferase
MNDSTVADKKKRFEEAMRSMGKVLIAYSGGVDSTLLLKVALDVLGPERVLAVTALSPLFPERELEGAKRTARALGARHILIESDELEIPEFVQNPPDHCYYCKRKLFGELRQLGAKEGFAEIVEGSTADDLKDHRPGRRAVGELGIRSPLMEAGLSKPEIREWSKSLGLPTWDKPSFACLASRFPYGDEISREALAKIDAAEAFLVGEGFRQVRVRHHGNLARIEVYPEEIERFLDRAMRERVVGRLKEIGYVYVAVDLKGFRSGSMNEML